MSNQILLYFPQSGEKVPIEKELVIIGRQAETCNLALGDYFKKGPIKDISRQHFEIKKQGESWIITDLDSTNKTEVNERILYPNTPTVLRGGEKIRLAQNDDFLIKVVIDKDSDATRKRNRQGQDGKDGKSEEGIRFDEKFNQFLVDRKPIPHEHLTEYERDLLKFLYAHKGHVCSYYDITQNVWGGWVNNKTTIIKMVNNLRKKLDKISLGAGKRYIKSVRNEGYKLYKLTQN